LLLSGIRIKFAKSGIKGLIKVDIAGTKTGITGNEIFLVREGKLIPSNRLFLA
jgi:hypothetical protein